METSGADIQVPFLPLGILFVVLFKYTSLNENEVFQLR